MNRNISKVQSVLISKQKFPTEHDAVQQVERMGYDAHFKLHPDSQQKNFWRFRQHIPFDDAQYISKKLSDGNRIVMDLQNHAKDEQRHQHVQDVIKNKRLKLNMGGLSHMSDQTKMGARHALDQLRNKDVHIPHIIEMNGMKFDLNRKRV